jgi:hypothetical protein
VAAAVVAADAAVAVEAGEPPEQGTGKVKAPRGP